MQSSEYFVKTLYLGNLVLCLVESSACLVCKEHVRRFINSWTEISINILSELGSVRMPLGRNKGGRSSLKLLFTVSLHMYFFKSLLFLPLFSENIFENISSNLYACWNLLAPFFLFLSSQTAEAWLHCPHSLFRG